MRSLLVLQLGLCIASQAHGVEYLYVEPNVGGSTGGHVALRLGDTVYDYQNAMLGTLRLRRSPYEHFRYVYSVLENRTIHVARLGVSEDAREALLDRLNRRYLVQEKHFAELESLEADLALIRSLRESAPDVRFDLRGAGFFYGGTEPERSEAIAALRARVEAHYGEGYLRARTAALAEEVNRLSPEVAEHSVAKLSKEDHAGSSYHFSERYTDLVSKLLALRAVEASRALRPEVRRAPQGDEFRLTTGERERIESMAHGLEYRLVELVESRRPDWGYTVLLGMARLEVLHASLRSGQLVFLDGFSPQPASNKIGHTFISGLLPSRNKQIHSHPKFARPRKQRGPYKGPEPGWHQRKV